MTRPRPPAKKRRPIFRLGNRDELPAEADIQKAIQLFRRTDQLVWLEGYVGNDGFGISMSFNPATYRSGGGKDFIEIALKEARLEFKPSTPDGWAWSDTVKELVKSSVSAVTIKLGEQHGSTSNQEFTGTSRLSGNARFGIPLFGEVKTTASQQLGVRRGNQRTTGVSGEVTRTEPERWAEMTRPEGLFQLRLGSPPGDDLIRFNSELDRLPVLSASEPSSITTESVKVTMSLQMKGELQHAVKIRDAGGRWQKLIDSRNKQIASELLVSKFLKSFHKPFTLWPKRKRPG